MRRLFSATTMLLAVISSASAEVTLPAMFSDSMVLQRGRPVPVWGTAEAGESVQVTFAGQVKTARADKQGRWLVKLDALEAGGPHTLTVKGSSRVTVGDVLVGEVWLASGQSNMAMTVRRCRDFKTEAAGADYPRIRMFTVTRHAALKPQPDCRGNWQVCSPETVGGFSGAAYFFGRRLHRELDVPVGLINSSWGGTAIEAWTSIDVQQKNSRLVDVLATWKETTKPNKNRPANLFNGMIHPLVPFAIRGAIWYQGERNARTIASATLYRHQLPLMIRDWRKRWGQGNFPFAWVQLPNFKARSPDPNALSTWALVRESMLLGLKEPATAMAVAIDIGEAGNIHPKNKQDIGDRLAQAGLRIAYNRDLVAMGPLMRSITFENDRVRVQFDHVGGGLIVRGQGREVRGFVVAGPDRRFHRAEARIEGRGIVARSKEVPDPIAIRYAWADNPDCNLFNKEGIPASPFRSDGWASER